ncbi:Crp/Fnr family transcriptional regulator [Aliiroseovarius sp. F20344]|uniref:Crp/Fnr family transcriptional regulator n=1 Tax=Aliiroseovarius sp. F20344 TaxID=2926414 RepID=UPI001FF2380D|nr:Crp/Fnr family transcriptional regulator [Aliiroseovarius sp. F20344]MCK0141962.1 Crp/Fnr family transcriptional regulator [Aliiroseovarius sp. F20344]
MISIIMKQITDIPPPFGSLPRHGVSLRELRVGDALFRQDDASRAMFFLRSGAINLIRHTEAGQKVTMFRATSGDTIAEPSVFSDHYHCDAISEQPSIVLSFDRQSVLAAMTTDSEFAAAFVKRLAGQVQTYRRQLELLAIRSAKDRVLAGLADGRLTGTVLDFAAELGLTHESVYRALADLTRDGRIEHPARGKYRLKPC